MAPPPPPLIVHVFLASPGDVPDERAFVRDYLESILPSDPLLERRARFEVASWDHPHAPTPMPAHLTPQEAVIRYERRPADCDIVVVILAGRLGTHLSLDALKRPDGSVGAVSRLAPEVANLEAMLRAARSSLLTEAVAALNGAARVWSVVGLGPLSVFSELAEACRQAGDKRGRSGIILPGLRCQCPLRTRDRTSGI